MNATLIKKELKENFYVSKGMWWLIVSALFLTAICMLVLNVREVGSLAQTELVQYAAKIGIFLCAMVTMVLGSSTFVAEREESTLESLMLAPVSKGQISLSKLMGTLAMGGLIYLVSLPYIVVLGAGTNLVLRSLLFMAVVGILLLVAFGCISISLSILVSSSKASILISILFLMAMTVPSFLSGVLEVSALGRFINQISPISNTFKLMSSVLVEQHSIAFMLRYFIPIVLFTLAGMAFLYVSTQKIAFKGGE